MKLILKFSGSSAPIPGMFWKLRSETVRGQDAEQHFIQIVKNKKSECFEKYNFEL